MLLKAGLRWTAKRGDHYLPSQSTSQGPHGLGRVSLGLQKQQGLHHEEATLRHLYT